jgi:hypothetical protein
MPYTIRGRYTAACNCNLLCPCPVDGPPTGEGGECRGFLVFGIREGSLDGTDLAGVNVALWNYFPSNLTAGNWTVGLVVDEAASDEQAQAVERIFSGQEGGPFGDFVPLIGTYEGMERGRVTVSDGSISVAGRGEATFEGLKGPDGSPTKVKSAMFGFAPEFEVGKATGRFRADREADARYGESADFEFSSEMGAEEIRPRA